MKKKSFKKSILHLGFCLSTCLFSPLTSAEEFSEDPWNFDLETDSQSFSQPILYSIDQKPQLQLKSPQHVSSSSKVILPTVGQEFDQKDFDKIKLIADDGKSDAILYQGAIDSYLKQLDTQNTPQNAIENQGFDQINRSMPEAPSGAASKPSTPGQRQAPVTPVTLERSRSPRTVPVETPSRQELPVNPNQTPSPQQARTLPSNINQQLPPLNVPPTVPNAAQQQVQGREGVLPNQGVNRENGIIQGLQPMETPPPTKEELDQRTISINFNNVNMVEFIRFVSRISGRNFLFDENDLQFNVTILFDEPTSIENILTALLQALRIHDLVLLEEGNNLIIHKNPKVGFLSQVVTDENLGKEIYADIITQVFKLNSVDVDTASAVLKPLLSDTAQISVVKNTNHLIVTDLSSNIREIARLLKSIDSPQSGLVIGQYVVRFAFIDTLIQLAQRIMQPISQNQPLIFVPHNAANSIFIVSTPYFVERTISILQYLDQNQGTTQILNPKDLQYAPPQGVDAKWKLDSNGNWIYDTQNRGDQPPRGRWVLDPQGNWRFEPGEQGVPGEETPEGRWVLNSQGVWVYQLNPGKPISPTTLKRTARFSQDLPVGNIARTQFFIHKLRYRRGDQIVQALTRIAESLQAGGNANPDLIATIAGIQWIESPNSLVVTGTSEAIEKLQDLIDEIDTPLRQVFLEMLILEMDIADSQEFAVNPGARFGGGNTAGNTNFLSGITTLPQMLNSTGLGVVPNPAFIPPANTAGFSLGVIGQTITRNGTQFASLGALVNAISKQDATRIVLNPKILTEDNSPAEIFVGENTQFPTQSIANNNGNIVTQNFEFRDVGTRLKVTPLIGNNDIITLDIQEEVSRIASGVSQISNLSNQVTGPTTTVNRTTTRVHMPDRYFLVLSGNLSDTERRLRTQTPCLGGIPVLGAAFSDKFLSDQRVNLMIFIYPQIIDTIEQLQNLTKHEQDIFRVKCRRKSQWRWDVDEALDWLNLEDWENNEGEWDCY